MLTAMAEAFVKNQPKKVIIDQALINVSHYSEPKNKGYINAILDKVIK